MGDNNLREVDVNQIHLEDLTYERLMLETTWHRIERFLVENKVIRGFHNVDSLLRDAETKGDELDNSAPVDSGEAMNKKVKEVVDELFQDIAESIGTIGEHPEPTTEAMLFDDAVWLGFPGLFGKYEENNKTFTWNELRKFARRAADEQKELEEVAEERKKAREDAVKKPETSNRRRDRSTSRGRSKERSKKRSDPAVDEESKPEMDKRVDVAVKRLFKDLFEKDDGQVKDARELRFATRHRQRFGHLKNK
ncbi:hypothetical protein CAEBREN_11755 [Caenorhabditis brenneri]|uniref:Uncharacterized protein n=1 Tax=Caenorhabditis brenneri TaxID=135651 RepID=G0PD89_CAEBE|nr:hypothetical protein CAEBREN_11755 [Caenorhabditis brenneri]